MKAPASIETERLLLRRPRAGDAEAIFTRYASDPEVTRFLSWPRHGSVADTQAFLAFSDAEWERWPAGPYLIVARGDCGLLGGTGLGFETQYRAATGYVLAKDAWGHGYATEALRAMVDLASRIGVQRLYAICHASHRASYRVLEKCGLEREGLLHRYEEFPNVAPGVPADVLCYATTFEAGSAFASPAARAGDRRRVFRDLHASGCFVIPNPWDAGSARVLARLGFPALATTSSGFAWSVGRPDNRVSLEQALSHFRSVADCVDVPVSGDFEGGFATLPAAVGAHVAAAIDTGIAGLSIEDSTGDPSNPLLDLALAVERIHAARQAIDDRAPDIVLTGRSEGFIVGRPDLAETIRRLTAYAEAGADCLYAPGIRTRREIAEVVRAVSPKPVNVLVGSDFATVAELAELGVRRISVGGGLARAAWTGFLRAAHEIAERGTFASLGRAVPFADVNRLFAADQ
jgi:methylisocitrate lyase